jgi:hypothetical protein
MKLEELLDVPALVLTAHSFPPVTRLLSGTFALGVPIAALGLRLGGWLSWHRRFQHVAGFLRSSEGDFAEPFFVFCSAVFCKAGWEKDGRMIS